MKNILIVFFIVFFILSILVFPFKIRIMGHFNLVELVGVYSIKIMIFRILTGRIKYQDDKFKVENVANILENDTSGNYSKILIKSIANKLDIKKIELYFKAGFLDDSFASALVCGGASSIVQTIYSVLSQKYYNVKLYEDIDPTFCKDNFELTFDGVVKISLISLVVSVIMQPPRLGAIRQTIIRTLTSVTPRRSPSGIQSRLSSDSLPSYSSTRPTIWTECCT